MTEEKKPVVIWVKEEIYDEDFGSLISFRTDDGKIFSTTYHVPWSVEE